VTRTGRVVRSPYAVGSRSEHIAVTLEAPDSTYKLMRAGGDAFSDPVLDVLVGKVLTAKGYVSGANFVLLDWTEVDDLDHGRDLPETVPDRDDAAAAAPDIASTSPR